MGWYLFLLLIIACPVMMMFMMRGGHGHGHGGHAQGSNGAQKLSSVDELRRRRDELDEEIATREGLREVDRDRHAERF